MVKDKNGKDTDVVLGYEDAQTYQQQTASFGAIVGRNCNRIADAQIVINDVTYQLERNDNENNLHSGSQATSRRLWDVEEHTANKVTFVIEDADGQQGYPGNAVMKVTYEVTEADELSITYHATADKTTVFNMTNHAYFNLNGAGSGTAMDQILQIRASHYTPVIDAKSIPTGEIASVEGTPFDFREAKPMGRDIEQASFLTKEAKAIMDGKFGYMIAMINNKTKCVPLEDVAGKLKTVDPDSQMIQEAKRIGISFGD